MGGGGYECIQGCAALRCRVRNRHVQTQQNQTRWTDGDLAEHRDKESHSSPITCG